MRGEYAAFVARLREHAKLANKTAETVRVDEGDPTQAVRENYIVAFPAIPDDLNDRRYTAAQRFESRRFMSFDVRVVAVDADGVLDLAEAVMQQLIAHTLVVEGRLCDPITMATDGVEEGTVRYDQKARLFYVDMSFEFVSRPIVP